jgi:hypothetical protein
VLQAHTAATFNGHDRLRPGERPISIAVAVDRDVAGIQLGYIRSFFSEIESLHRKVRRNVASGLELSNKVDIAIVTNSFRAVRGRSVLFATMDEAAFFRGGDDASANADSELYTALKPGLARVSDSMLVAISSPYRRSGLLFEKYKQHFGKDSDDTLFVKAPTLLLNPTLDPAIVAKAYEDDPAAAASEWGGEFRSDIADFVEHDAVAACVSVGVRERPYTSGRRYVAHVDPSGGVADSFTLAIGHMEKDIATLDCLREARPPFSPESVTAEFANTLKSYRVSRVVGDRFAGQWPRQSFQRNGVDYLLSDRSASDYYRDCLPLLNSRRVDLLDDRRLIAQLVGLERRVSRNGKDVISHRIGSHDDVANSAAACLCAASKPREAVFATYNF